jgi:hypothetical protein
MACHAAACRRKLVAQEGVAPSISVCWTDVILFHDWAKWLPGIELHHHKRLQRTLAYY